MPAKHKEVKAVILTADRFEDMELFFPLFRLMEEGIHVDIAGPRVGEVHGENGYGLHIEKTFDDINPDDYALLILPGGAPDGAPSTVRNSAKARSIAKAFMDANKQARRRYLPRAVHADFSGAGQGEEGHVILG